MRPRPEHVAGCTEEPVSAGTGCCSARDPSVLALLNADSHAELCRLLPAPSPEDLTGRADSQLTGLRALPRHQPPG